MVYYCEYNPSTDGLTIRIVADNMAMANGIAMDT